MTHTTLPALPLTTVDEHVLIVDQQTGELVDLRDASNMQLAWALDAMAEHKREIATWQRLVSDEVLRRMDAGAAWTIHTKRFTLQSRSPEPELEYDAQELRAALLDMAATGRFSPEAADRAVEKQIIYKPRATALKALAKLGEDVAAVIDRFARPVERTRSVRVTRS